MLCAIYKSRKKEGMYLYIEKRDNFSAVPEALLHLFGQPQFVMLFNLLGQKKLVQVENQIVLAQIKQQGFYLQMPPPPENLLTTFKQAQLPVD
ncbi:YcgL domain-containing protein [Gallibacterium trehalosifermentans]|uniref:YcgL domain-containing protein ACFFHK_00585 n=1 Tax=Gallibacterium trehalosifermentans TaxID=516935 RepID=A0ABV6GYQ2_9PAST